MAKPKSEKIVIAPKNMFNRKVYEKTGKYFEEARRHMAVKRLSIFVTYDAENIVDAYIGYMLQELRQIVDYLVVVCNYKYISKGINNLQPYADEIYYRENRGFDAGAFKDVLCSFVGWDVIDGYDELLLVNDSFFGPFRSMRDIFAKMDKRSCDFWGLSTCKIRLHPNDLSFAPEHIQSFFIVFRRRLLHTSVFREFWEEMPYYHGFQETIEKYEIRLTDFFHRKGYQYDCYADMKANITDNVENGFNQYLRIPNEMIQKRDFPFLKKKSIDHDPVNGQTQENIPLVFDYIKNQTDYDINLIYENIIRLMNVSDLQRRLCLHYILSDKKQTDKYQNLRTAVVVIAEYSNSYEYVMEYINKISERCSILILSKSETVLSLYRQSGHECINCVENQKDQILDDLESYDYVGIVHDTDMSSDRKPNYVGKSMFYHLWENIAGGVGYIDNVVNVFLENEKIGLLTIPRANFDDYFGDIGAGWNGKFEDVQKIVKKYQIHCNLDYMKPPFEPISDFWVRGELLQSIRRAGKDLLKLLPWVWCYIAQDQGYLSGVVENRQCAEMNAINKQYYLDVIGEQIKRQFGEFRSLLELQELLSRRALVDYCQKYRSVYVYGTGNIAEKYSLAIPNVEAYVVSDGQNKQQNFKTKKVLYLSEISCCEETGLVVCLDKKNQFQVIPQILNRGFKDYFCV